MASTGEPDFFDVFRRYAGPDGSMSFTRFMQLALYDPDVGYYTRPGPRIGRDPGTDFYTGPSLGPVFGELVAAACLDLLGGAGPARHHAFVEIGAESPAPPVRQSFGENESNVEGPDSARGRQTNGGLTGVAPFFGEVRNIALGQPLAVPPRAVVFSNELFDAQPCHRLVRRRGVWRETGVALRAGGLEEILLPDLSPEVRAVRDRLPVEAVQGYRLQLPPGAAALDRV